jgi:RNA polymerase sigma-70 factor (sigma-E family)
MTTGGENTGSSHEDELLTHVYRQVTDRQAAQYAATYDTDAGLARFKDRLQEHTAADEDQAQRAALTEPDDATNDDSAANTSSEEAGRIHHLPRTRRKNAPWRTAGNADLARESEFSDSAIATLIRADADALPVPFRPMPAELELDAYDAVTKLYSTHYRSLVRLAGLLVRDEPTAEEVVQECFVAMHDGWHRLREEDKTLSYLKQAIVNRARSVLQHRAVMDRNAPKPAPDMPSAEQGAMALLERRDVIAALQALPIRQREALILRYYADLSDAQIAQMMGISKGAVKSHTARGMASLRAVLERLT